MTTLAHSSPSDEPAHQIDVRCSAALPDRSTAQGRCQLFAGHDGPHAVMFARSGRRTVRLWRGRDAATALDARAAALQRPWMFGFPAPAWFESDEPADLSG